MTIKPVYGIAVIFLSGAAAINARAAEANSLSARDVLNRVSAAYSHLSSIRIGVKREDTVIRKGQAGQALSEYELAAQGKQRYFIRVKQNHAEAIAVSDGDNTWKALVSQKQWTHTEASTTAGDDDDAQGEEEIRTDLYGRVSAVMFGQYPAFARLARDAQITREADFKLGSEKIRCYIVRLQIGNGVQELWVDKQRFLVLQRLQKTETGDTSHEIRIKTISIEVNQPIADSTFRFAPEKGWSQLEMLVLPGEQSVLLTGSRAANFSLKTLEGEPIDLSQTRGKVVVLDFWATWCPPCRKELPSIEKMRSEFGDAVRIYGINDEDAGTVREFVKKHHYEMTVLMDGKKQVHRQYGISSIPTLLILDKQGIIRTLFVGSQDEPTIRKSIQSALAAN